MKAYRVLSFVLAAALALAWPVAASAADAAKADSKATGKAAIKEVPQGNPGASFQAFNYVLSPTDIINLNVVDDPKATADYSISVDGSVQLAYLPDHPLKLAGLTVAEAVKLVSQTYVDEKIFIKPTITISVKQYSERRINVFGNVAKPGPVSIPPQKKMTLVSAISEANGPTARASRTVTIKRIQADGTTKTFDDVDLLGAMKGTADDFPLQEGDTITVGESMFGNVYQ